MTDSPSVVELIVRPSGVRCPLLKPDAAAALALVVREESKFGPLTEGTASSSSSSMELAGLRSRDHPPGKCPKEAFLETTEPRISGPGLRSSAFAVATIMADGGGGLMFSK